jgi:hypothetical protein
MGIVLKADLAKCNLELELCRCDMKDSDLPGLAPSAYLIECTAALLFPTISLCVVQGSERSLVLRLNQFSREEWWI